MRFTTEPKRRNEIKEGISKYFEEKNCSSFKALLINSGLSNYKNKTVENQSLNNFVENFYSLLIDDFEKKYSVKTTDLIKFLNYIQEDKLYNNNDNKEAIKEMIVKLEQEEKKEQEKAQKPLKPKEKKQLYKVYKEHYNCIVEYLKNGTLIPILGRNINLCDRQQDNASWTPQSPYPPTTRELAQYLTKNCSLSHSITEITAEEEVRCSLRKLGSSEAMEIVTLIDPSNNQKLAVEIDLPYLSECVTLRGGYDAIYNQLRSLFQNSFNPTTVHKFLAKLPTKLKEDRDFSHTYPLILTTNYDDVLEKTFDLEQDCYDVLSYIAKGEDRGRFRHRSSEDCKQSDEGKVIKNPGRYKNCNLRKQPVILKIHGALDWSDGDTRLDGFVITEDHYIDYLARTDVVASIPANIKRKLTNSNLLFLGYDLSDWCMRAILHSIWKEQPLNYPDYKSWVVPVGLGKLNRQLWHDRNAHILDVPLKEFITELDQRL